MPTGAFNYRAVAWDTGNISSLQKRVSIFMGLKVIQTQPLSNAFTNVGLELVSEEPLAGVQGRTGALDFGGSQETVRRRFREVPLLPPVNDSDSEFPAMLSGEISYLKNKVVSGSILRNGIHLDRYRVGSAEDEDSIQLIFRPHEGEQWQLLGSYSSEDEAITAANSLRRLLIRLNVESEGLHLVEHILLRPLAQESYEGITVPPDFYPFKLSVLFPAWTARFHDPEFRRVAEEIVEQNCPAHVHPEFHWLEFEEMKRFEGLYKSWLELKRDESAAPGRIDGGSKQLISFLMETGARPPVTETDRP